MHLVSLQHVGGVEVHFTEFVEHAVRRYPQWRHVSLNPQRTVHPFFGERLQRTLARTVYAKYRWGIKVPTKPAWVRSWHCRRLSASTQTDIALIWNRTARTHFLLDAIGAENCIHWEHSAAWYPGRERERTRYLRRIPLAIVNSRASARVLQLLLRPSLMPEAPRRKNYPEGRPIRLGVAARLLPVKGLPLVLHALKILNARSADFELHIAGAGPEFDGLQLVARDLNVASQCHFRGAVQDMRSFYGHIDCLVHPPLSEPFGLVAIEAAAQGCPVIAATVDGLPEAVEHGVSGLCIEPLLPLSEYPAFDGAISGIPERVYDPLNDELREPKIVDPASLADSVRHLFGERGEYERMSASASEHVLTKFRFDDHLDDVMAVIDRFASGRADRGHREAE
jgi:glycosyltransferase involved in cell wall biosynthesis